MSNNYFAVLAPSPHLAFLPSRSARLLPTASSITLPNTSPHLHDLRL